MLKSFAVPTSLRQAMKCFADPDVALSVIVQLRWPNGLVCPRCGEDKPSFLTTRRIWTCRACHKQFSVKVGTIFEDSPLGLDKWLTALWMLANCKNGISSYELGRALGVTQKTAWFMLGRIRLAMQTRSFGQFGGEVEIDETYIGGLAKFTHKGRGSRHKRVITGTGGMGKVAVMGILERPKGPKGRSRVRTTIVKSTKKRKLQAHVRANVEAGSKVYTDALRSYQGLAADYEHAVIDHAYEYARGRVHTNGLENFWSLLKRAIKGTCVSVDPYHVFRYLDEQVFRLNSRKATDGERFVDILNSVMGKRLDYRGLTGKQLVAEPA